MCVCVWAGHLTTHGRPTLPFGPLLDPFWTPPGTLLDPPEWAPKTSLREPPRDSLMVALPLQEPEWLL